MWTMSDYPNSWKNLETLERKKAIDIGNAMLKDGYEENDIIPIATKQAKEWYRDATEDELSILKNKKITQHDKNDSAHPKLMNQDVEVYYEDESWKVKSKSASQASNVYDTKQEAVNRANEIANKRGTKVIKHNKN